MGSCWPAGRGTPDARGRTVLGWKRRGKTSQGQVTLSRFLGCRINHFSMLVESLCTKGRYSEQKTSEAAICQLPSVKHYYFGA